MPAPSHDPLYVKNKEAYFIEIAKTIAKASTHPLAPGACVIVRDREIIGEGRAILTASKIEIDCLSVAIGACQTRHTNCRLYSLLHSVSIYDSCFSVLSNGYNKNCSART